MVSGVNPFLYWLFRLGGVLPNNTTYDRYLIVVITTLEGLCILSILKTGTSYNSIYYQVIDLFFIFSVLYLVYKIQLSKQNAIDLFTKCLLDVRNVSSGQDLKRFEIAAVLTFSFIFLLRILTVFLESHSYARRAMYNIGMALIYVPIVLHIVLVRHLGARFSEVNDQLRGVLEAIRDRSAPTANLRCDLEGLFRRHVHLRYIRGQINIYFGFYNVITFTCRLAFVVVLMYFIITVITDPLRSLKPKTCFEFISVVTSLCGQCDVCYRCSEQVTE